MATTYCLIRLLNSAGAIAALASMTRNWTALSSKLNPSGSNVSFMRCATSRSCCEGAASGLASATGAAAAAGSGFSVNTGFSGIGLKTKVVEGVPEDGEDGSAARGAPAETPDGQSTRLPAAVSQ